MRSVIVRHCLEYNVIFSVTAPVLLSAVITERFVCNLSRHLSVITEFVNSDSVLGQLML